MKKPLKRLFKICVDSWQCYQTQGVHCLGYSIQELDVAIVRQFYLLAASKGNRGFTSKALSPLAIAYKHCLADSFFAVEFLASSSCLQLHLQNTVLHFNFIQNSI